MQQFTKTSGKLLSRLLLFTITFLVSLNVSASHCKNSFSQNQNDTIAVGNYFVTAISSLNNTYGYEIFDNSGFNLKQTTRPYFSIPLGFKNKVNAYLVGKLHAFDLSNGIKNFIFTVEDAKKAGVTAEDLSL